MAVARKSQRKKRNDTSLSTTTSTFTTTSKTTRTTKVKTAVGNTTETVTDSGSSFGESWICALIEGRGTGREIGLAAWGSDTGKCILTQVQSCLGDFAC